MPSDPPVPAPLTLPEQFGRYRILRPLGQGGMGAVYLARDTRLDRDVALKVCTLVENPKALERFRREAKAAAALRHPNLCPLYDYDVHDGIAFITMAFIDGPSLNKWIANHPLDMRGVGKLVYKLALAMQAAHDGGVIHRDLKPGNVAIDKKGEPIILDFGLAKMVDARSQQTVQGAVFGTLTHMAPEQALGQNDQIGPATDVYALGVILYELLTGDLPFVGSQQVILAQLLAATPQAPRKLNPDVPEALEVICLKALAKKPEERYPAMKAMADALARAVRGLPGASKTVPVSAPPPEGTALTQSEASHARTLPPQLPTASAPRRRDTKPARGNALGLTLLVLVLAGLLGAGGYGIYRLWANQRARQTDGPGTTEPKRDTTPKDPPKDKPKQPGDVIQKPALRLTVAPELSLKVGDAAPLAVQVERTNCPGPIILRAELLPVGVMAKDGRIEAGQGGGSLVVSVNETAPESSTLRVVAESDGVQQSATVRVVVAKKAELVIRPLKDITLSAGESHTFDVELQRKNCPGPVTLRLERLAEGLTTTERRIDAGKTEGGLRLAADSTMAAGEHSVRVVAEADGVKATADLRVVVVKKAEAESDRLEVTLKTSKKLVIDLVRIPKGKFLMGSSKSEREDLKKRYDYEPKDEDEHEVEITRDYWLGKTTITRGQFRAFVEDDGYVTEAEKDGEGGWGYDEATGKLEGRKPKYTWKFTGWGMDDKNLDDHPVVNVTWNDADAYCKWLKRKTGREVRLPTEAEWERACRGGERKGRYHFGDDEEDLAKYGNVADASFKKKFPDWTWTIKADDGFVFTAPVKSFRPNQYGLYDMHGNVWQWCNDRYGADYYGKGDRTDPQGPDDGSSRVSRGGGWEADPQYCRAAYRSRSTPSHRNSDLGFRLAVSVR